MSQAPAANICPRHHSCSSSASTSQHQMIVKAIGFIRTPFPEKNACPRQGTIAAGAIAKLKLDMHNANDYLQGLENYTHAHIIFQFHLNKDPTKVKPKVRPPLLDGKKVGVFSTRAPHRPNAIGLTVARIVKVENGTIHFDGVDLVSGTPVLDVKPYIPRYDAFPDAEIAAWVRKPPVKKLTVSVSELAERQMRNLFDADAPLDDVGTLKTVYGKRSRCQFYESYAELIEAINEILSQDTRSITSRRHHTSGVGQDMQKWPFPDLPAPSDPAFADRGSYGVCLDVLCLRCRFQTDTTPHTIRILHLEDWQHVHYKK